MASSAAPAGPPQQPAAAGSEAEAEAEAEEASGTAPTTLDHEPYRLNLFQALRESQQGGIGLGGSGSGGLLGGSSLHPPQDGPSSMSSSSSHSYYASYRRRCTAKIARVVRRRSVRHVLLHSHRYHSAAATTTAEASSAATTTTTAGHNKTGGAHSTASKKKRQHAYFERDLSVVVHEDCLWHLLFQAERAWASAGEIQRMSATTGIGGGNAPTKRGGGGGGEGRKRRHAIRKLQKAAHWSRRLRDLAHQHCDAVSAEECRSYAEYMAGNVALEKRRYRSALHHYRVSRSILRQLAEEDGAAGSTSEPKDASAEALARRDVWTTRADSLLQPLIRYCEYESRGADDGNDDEDIASSPGAAPSSSSSPSPAPEPRAAVRGGGAGAGGGGEILLSFRGRTVALDSYQELAVLYLKLEQQLSGGGGGASTGTGAGTAASIAEGLDEDAFLAVSGDLDAAVRLVRAEARRYETLPDGPAVRSRRDDLASIRHYFEHHKLALWRRQQEMRLAGATEATEVDLLHVYDTLLQNAVSTADLQQQQQQQQSGAGAGAADDDPLWLETQAHVLRFRAFRCYYLARHYEECQDLTAAAAPADSAAAPAALFRQAAKLAARAIEEADACDGMEANVEALNELAIRIRAALCRVEALRWLEENGAHAVVATSRPLWMRLNDWDHGAGSRYGGGKPDTPSPAIAYADNPPLLMAVPCKPSFFDVAWQHLPRDEYDVARQIGNYLSEHEPRRGFLDWVRGG